MLSPAFLFAPGAGAPSSHPWMQHWMGLLGKLGPVEMLDYPYMLEKRGRPDPLPRLVGAHATALARLRAKHPGPIVLIGKSMGGRIGCHVALKEKVHAIVCLGYPLCGGGERTKMRDAVLRELSAPILFVQGTRDPLCPLDLLATVRAGMRAPNQLEIVQDGDHSLAVTKRQLKADAEDQGSVNRRIINKIGRFVASPI